jgi:hypothetical protein
MVVSCDYRCGASLPSGEDLYAAREESGRLASRIGQQLAQFMDWADPVEYLVDVETKLLEDLKAVRQLRSELPRRPR